MLEQAQQDALDTSNVSSRVETWRRDEPSGIWAYLYIASSNILRDFQHDEWTNVTLHSMFLLTSF